MDVFVLDCRPTVLTALYAQESPHFSGAQPNIHNVKYPFHQDKSSGCHIESGRGILCMAECTLNNVSHEANVGLCMAQKTGCLLTGF